MICVYVQRVITMPSSWIEERSISHRGSSSHRADSAENNWSRPSPEPNAEWESVLLGQK